MSLTDLALKNLPIKEKAYTVNDMNGLGIYVSPHGTKSWHFRYSWQNKQKRIVIGKYPIVSIQAARLKSIELQSLLTNGIDPKSQKLSAKRPTTNQQLTFAEFIPEWKEIKYLKLGYIDPNRRNSTQVQIERYLKKDMLPALGHIPMNQITRQDVLGVLRNMEKRHAFIPAEKVRGWLNEIFKHAIVVGHIDINPASDMEIVALPKPPVKNNPYLTMDNLPELLAALHDYPGERYIQLALNLLLLTGVRPGELRFSKPQYFDLKNALWTIPAIEVKQFQCQAKSGEKIPDYLIPLPTQATEIVKELLAMCFKNQKYLLIGRTDPTKPISENTLNQGLHRIGYKGKLTTHGIRATISTALYELEYEGKWIEGQLSHVDPNPIVRTYNHAKYVPQRRKMMQEWANRLDIWRKEALSQRA